ncbi:MAG: hypothetical protein U0Y82_14400 [Thermoleophilia bacterium]
MTWLVLLVGLAVGLGGGWMAYRSSRRWRARELRRVQLGTPTHARVLELHVLGAAHHRAAASLHLRLMVESATGTHDREVVVGWEVPEDRLDEVRVGQRVRVRVDRYDPDRVYPDMAGAEWWAPAV